MKFLHISDLHFNIKNYDSDRMRKQFISDLKRMKLQIDFILITGDILYKYKENATTRNNLVDYIFEIAKSCNCSRKKIYICPGNHDVSRTENARTNIIREIEKKRGF